MENEKTHRIVLEVPQQDRAEIKARAALRNISMKQWILEAVAARIRSEQKYE